MPISYSSMLAVLPLQLAVAANHNQLPVYFSEYPSFCCCSHLYHCSLCQWCSCQLHCRCWCYLHCRLLMLLPFHWLIAALFSPPVVATLLQPNSTAACLFISLITEHDNSCYSSKASQAEICPCGLLPFCCLLLVLALLIFYTYNVSHCWQQLLQHSHHCAALFLFTLPCRLLVIMLPVPIVAGWFTYRNYSCCCCSVHRNSCKNAEIIPAAVAQCAHMTLLPLPCIITVLADTVSYH